MEALLPTIFMLGLDGFVVCVGLGSLENGRRLRYPLLALFGLCDGTATLIGALNGPFSPFWTWCAAYGVCVLALAWRGWVIPAVQPLMLLLPILLALDNLTVAVASDGLPIGAHAVVTGLVSGSMAFAGLSLGSALANRFRANRFRLASGYIAGPCLLVAAVILATA